MTMGTKEAIEQLPDGFKKDVLLWLHSQHPHWKVKYLGGGKYEIQEDDGGGTYLKYVLHSPVDFGKNGHLLNAIHWELFGEGGYSVLRRRISEKIK